MAHGYSQYPQSYDNYTYKVNITDNVNAVDVNELQDGIESIQQTLGINPQGSKTTIAERLDASMDSSGAITTSSTAADYFQVDSNGTTSSPYLSFGGVYDKRLTWSNSNSRFEFGGAGYFSGALTLAGALSGVTTLTATTGNITTVNATDLNASSNVSAVTGAITTLNTTTGNITTVASTTVGATTGNITTVNSTTGNITTVAATTVGATTGNITTVNSTTVGATTANITTCNVTTNNYTKAYSTPVSATTAINCAAGTIFYGTYTSSPTVTFTNFTSGQTVMLAASASGGNRTLSFSSSGDTFKWAGGVDCSTITSGYTYIYTLVKIGTTIYINTSKDFS